MKDDLIIGNAGRFTLTVLFLDICQFRSSGAESDTATEPPGHLFILASLAKKKYFYIHLGILSGTVA